MIARRFGLAAGVEKREEKVLVDFIST